MAPFPLALGDLLGHWPSYIVYLAIGFAFGYVLEIGGFGDSRILAAQFYFKDLTVLKVMFGAIVTAMVLVFLASGLGILDFNLVWVNPTYLWPGIVGGLIMGVGFIVGGFCPGTSLVSAAVLRKDGIFFALGVFFGIFLFGETVSFYEDFWYSSYMGRFTLMEWLNLPTGVIVLLIILMALFMFWGGEKLEAIFGKKDISREPKWRYTAAGLLVLGAIGTVVIGQPDTNDKWAQIEEVEGARLANREVQIHPGELLEKLHDASLSVVMLDVRSEADFNQFHIRDARRVDLDDLQAIIPELLEKPANTLFVVMSNEEVAATEAWKVLRAESVPSAYILEGGINNWLTIFADDEFKATQELAMVPEDGLAYSFPTALGARYDWAEPDPHNYELVYTPKVELEIKRGPSGGGCG
ncbi:MAG: YeeE/YedE family protein [Anaerolineales bacterium]|nr:YeeE/YedE family protein [Anaerolineales bacterium]MCB0018105.1 YeeE/YedE family protein [Anaerolineales bacterium]